MTPLVIVGCGGFGREVHDVVDAINTAHAGKSAHPGDPVRAVAAPSWELLGYVDDSPSQRNLELVDRRGARVLGGLDALEKLPRDVAYVIGIGSPRIKARIDARLGDRPAAVLLHPTVSTGFDVRFGPGSVVCAGAVLTTNIRLGRHVHINLLCSIGHDVTLGDHVSINPLVAVSGDVDIEDRVMLGTHSAILQTLRVGADATVGGAALVVKDVPAGTVVKGVPAR
ncbi:MAG: acetyltransferase [Micrococcales bacterium]|nr:acetyltransferase [Micrococcales bacterium]